MKDLDKFKNEMNLSGGNVYVGHRYVPKIFGEWNNKQIYEPLSIVQFQGTSYTSRQYVPVGIEITNEEFWVVTGNYNAQVEQYRQEVNAFDDRINDNETSIVTLDEKITETDETVVTLDEKTNEAANVINVYVSPLNFDSLDECIQYAVDNRLTIKADKITLTKDTVMRDVGVEINEIDLNGFKLYLGAYNVDNPSKPTTNGKVPRPNQTINNIIGGTNNQHQLYILGACYQTITIDHYNGFIQMLLDGSEGEGDYTGTNPSTFISYNVFNFNDVKGIEVKEKPNTKLQGQNLWANENEFNLGNTGYFRLGDVGGYKHNLNVINRGCFEGNSGRIILYATSSNVFNDIRAEGRLTLELSNEAMYNTFKFNHMIYRPFVKDEGLNNKIITSTEKDLRLISNDKLVSGGIGMGPNAVPITIQKPFDNIIYDSLTGSYQWDEASEWKIIYQSQFLPNPQNIRVQLESNLISGVGFGIGYKYYDMNYNDITIELSEKGFTAYSITTFESNVNTNNSYGALRGPSTGNNGYTNTLTPETSNVKNDKLVFLPSGHWYSNENASQVKYVKFFITNAGEELTFKDLNFYIYDVKANYRTIYHDNALKLN